MSVKWFYFVTCSWRNEVTGTCLISRIWDKSCRYTCFPNLVIIGLTVMEISILISVLNGNLGKTELIASISHIAVFLKSGITIYNSKVPDTAGRKTRRRRTYTIAKHDAFHADTKICADSAVFLGKANEVWHIKEKKIKPELIQNYCYITVEKESIQSFYLVNFFSSRSLVCSPFS